MSHAYNHFHNILRLSDVLPNCFSPQVKWCLIITYKHGIYELPHEFPKDLRLRMLVNKEISGIMFIYI